MKLKALSLHSVIFSFLVTVGMTAQSQPGLTVQNVDVDTVHNVATIRLMNSSEKTVTAFTIAVVEVYQKGGVHRHQLTEDYGPNLTAEGKAFDAGQIREEPDHYSETADNSVVHVDAKVVAVIYADQSAEGEDEPLERVVAVRKGIAAALDHSAKTLQAALNDSSESHPGTKAAEIIKAAAAKNPPGMDKVYLEDTAKTLEHAGEDAIAQNRPERDLLRERLTTMQEEALRFADFAEIKGRHEDSSAIYDPPAICRPIGEFATVQ